MRDKLIELIKELKRVGYEEAQADYLLANGVNNIHIYTMNKPDTAAKIFENLSSIIKTKK